MFTITDPLEMQSWGLHHRGQKATMALVPTMGALHEGHAALIRRARQDYAYAVVSIFVNPKQFDRAEDLAKYPQTLAADLKLCESLDVDVVFTPTVEVMYPENYQTLVRVPKLSEGLCGGKRPGHFDGVSTVVLKLFQLTQATHALFGAKDFQQLAVIRQMTHDLNLPIEILSHPIVREASGLALSSRNQRLSPQGKDHALTLFKALKAVEAIYQQGEREAKVLLQIGTNSITQNVHLDLDYAELVDAATLEAVRRLDRPALFAVAAFVEGVRLIDNIVLES